VYRDQNATDDIYFNGSLASVDTGYAGSHKVV